jgi:hypothetical protein
VTGRKIDPSARCLLLGTPRTYFRAEGISDRAASVRSDGRSRQIRDEESDQINRAYQIIDGDSDQKCRTQNETSSEVASNYNSTQAMKNQESSKKCRRSKQ